MKVKALLLEREGKSIEGELLSSLKQAGLLDKCYAYKSRVKSDERLIEKVQIRRDDGIKDYEITDITDVVGIRLMTLFRVDMVSIFETIIKIIKYEYELAPNPFSKDGFEELIFYTNRTNDKIHLSLKDVVVKYKLEDIYKLKQREGEYSSIHIVVRSKNKVKNVHEDDELYFLPVEIQIRTVFEDAWGEVDHKYGYSIRRGKKTNYKVRNPQSILRHLDTLKRFSDACGEYADAIHLSILDDNREETGKANLRSVEADQETIDLFRELKIDVKLVDKYISARALRESGLTKKSRREEDSNDLLLEAAFLFKDLSEKKVEDEVNGHKIFSYYTKMNYAFCLLSTNLKKEADEALKIYVDLEKDYQDFLLVKMRLAQAYEKNNYIDLALKKCDEAYLIYKNIESEGFVESIELPQADFSHIQKYLPKIYGYFLWIKSEKMSAIDTRSAINKTSVLRKAYFLTQEALEHDKENPSLYNNILYYTLDIMKIVKSFDKVRVRKEIIDSIEKYLLELAKRINFYETENIVILDTAVKVYDYLGDTVERDKIITRVIPIAEKLLVKQDGEKEMIEAIIKEAKAVKPPVIC
jgi:ppGpp synthetase/RelA/SpoT-type nucleotidyltranferase